MLERITYRAKTFGGNLSTGQRIVIGAGGAGALALVGGIANRDRIINTAMRSDILVRSNAPMYKKVGWKLTDIDPAEIENWLKFDGDPEGTRLPIPRFYKSVGILAMKGAELEELRKGHEGLVPAVAWVLGNRVVVGELPDEKPAFGLAPERDGDDLHAIGMRVGYGDLKVTAGLWNPDTQILDVPDSLKVLTEGVPISGMDESHRYPRVPII